MSFLLENASSSVQPAPSLATTTEELTAELLPGQTTADRLDLVVRVFTASLDTFVSGPASRSRVNASALQGGPWPAV